MARFDREAKAMAALSHPGILAIFDFGEYDGTAYTASELIAGETLRDIIHRGPMAIGSRVELAVQVTRALNAAHAVGIVHGISSPRT